MVWTKHLQDSKARESFEGILRNNVQLFTRLTEIIEETERDLNSKETSIDDFGDPNWAYKQAYRNGERSQLRKIKQLFEFIKG